MHDISCKLTPKEETICICRLLNYPRKWVNGKEEWVHDKGTTADICIPFNWGILLREKKITALEQILSFKGSPFFEQYQIQGGQILIRKN